MQDTSATEVGEKASPSSQFTQSESAWKVQHQMPDTDPPDPSLAMMGGHGRSGLELLGEEKYNKADFDKKVGKDADAFLKRHDTLKVDSIKVYQAKGIVVWRLFWWTMMVIFVLVVFSVFFDIVGNLIGSGGRDVIENRSFLLFIGLMFYITGLVLIIYRWFVISYEIKPGHVVFMKNGIFSKDIKNYSLTSVESISLDKSFLGKLLNYGNLSLDKPAHRDSEQILGIPDPEKYQRIVEIASSSAPLNAPEEDFK